MLGYRQALIQCDQCPCKKRSGRHTEERAQEDTDTWRKNAMRRQRQRLAGWIYKPRSANKQKLKDTKGFSPQQVSEGAAETLISDLYSPELWENKFCCFQPPVCSSCFWRPRRLGLGGLSHSHHLRKHLLADDSQIGTVKLYSVIVTLPIWHKKKILLLPFFPFPQIRFWFPLTQRRYSWTWEEMGAGGHNTERKRSEPWLLCFQRLTHCTPTILASFFLLKHANSFPPNACLWQREQHVWKALTWLTSS